MGPGVSGGGREGGGGGGGEGESSKKWESIPAYGICAARYANMFSHRYLHLHLSSPALPSLTSARGTIPWMSALLM